MANSVDLTIGGDANQVLREMARVTKSMENMADGMRRVSRESRATGEAQKETNDKISKMAGYAKGIVSGLIGAGGVAGAISLVRQGVTDWQRDMDSLSKTMQQTANDMVALAALAEPGKKGETIKSAIISGMKYMTPGESIATYQTALSISQSPQKAAQAVEATGQLIRLGVEPAQAREAITIGTGTAGQMPPWKAAGLAYAAGKESGRTPAEVVKAAPALKVFQDKTMAWAVAARLAETGSAEQLREATQAVGIGLGKETEKYGELWKKLRVAKGTQFERLAALEKKGYRTPAELQKLGLEQLEARSIAPLLQNMTRLRETMAIMEKTVTPGYLEREYMGTELETWKSGLPQLMLNRKIEESRRRQMAQIEFAPDIGEAGIRKYEKTRRAEIYRKFGYGEGFLRAIGPEDTEAGGKAIFLRLLRIGLEGGGARDIIAETEALVQLKDEIKGLRVWLQRQPKTTLGYNQE